MRQEQELHMLPSVQDSMLCSHVEYRSNTNRHHI